MRQSIMMFVGVCFWSVFLAPAWLTHFDHSSWSIKMPTALAQDGEGEIPASIVAGAWIVDAGPNQIKTVTSYMPIGGGQYAVVESVFNFDWSLGGAMPTATHASTLNGILEENDVGGVDFVLITYALDEMEQAVYILKAVGSKVIVDEDTLSVVDLVFHIYTEPETDNAVTDEADFTIPDTGTFPPVHEYRITFNNGGGNDDGGGGTDDNNVADCVQELLGLSCP